MGASSIQKSPGAAVAVVALVLTASTGAEDVRYERSLVLVDTKLTTSVRNVDRTQTINAVNRVRLPRDIEKQNVAASAIEKNVQKRPTSPCDEAMQLDSLPVEDLITWIIKTTGWNAREPPSICFVPLSQLVKIYAKERDASLNDSLKAFYLTDKRTVYLPTNWNPNTLLDRAALLHELVHHLQTVNNVKMECQAAYERQSYQLTVKWLRNQGVANPYEFLEINQFTIQLFFLCMEPHE